MAHILLKALDREYKQKRAELISPNYDAIVSKIHNQFQLDIVNKISELQVKEIVKFDYMTNLEVEGDIHLSVDFVDNNNILHHFKSVINSSSYSILDKKRYISKDVLLTFDLIDDFSKLCLSEFRRGYDKPLTTSL